jgi:hypothetical protein
MALRYIVLTVTSPTSDHRFVESGGAFCVLTLACADCYPKRYPEAFLPLFVEGDQVVTY